MKDITIIDNFISDEELKETLQISDNKSLNFYDEKNTVLHREWYFNSYDNCYKKCILDLHGDTFKIQQWGMEYITPYVKNFILKIKNRIEKCMNTKFDLDRVYLNHQVCGQDVPLHLDTDRENGYTLLIYIGDITPENYAKTGGDLEFKNKENTRVEPFTKRAVLFRGDIPHKAFAPLVPGITRISFAFKLFDTSNKAPFIISYT
jgi:hypothetical protein|tara:strand:- start:13 stop:627 length:615 start_codon:yes stop_codon:yes gene_type:complete